VPHNPVDESYTAAYTVPDTDRFNPVLWYRLSLVDSVLPVVFQ
jgi:hypothetical protein